MLYILESPGVLPVRASVDCPLISCPPLLPHKLALLYIHPSEPGIIIIITGEQGGGDDGGEREKRWVMEVVMVHMVVLVVVLEGIWWCVWYDGGEGGGVT